MVLKLQERLMVLQVHSIPEILQDPAVHLVQLVLMVLLVLWGQTPHWLLAHLVNQECRPHRIRRELQNCQAVPVCRMGRSNPPDRQALSVRMIL